MPRTLFLSFLGASEYIPCIYYVEGEPADEQHPEMYIQSALLDRLRPRWTGRDAVYIAATAVAQAKNWEGAKPVAPDGTPWPNLYETLQAKGIPGTVELIHIAEGFSEKEVWVIFKSIYDKLERGDRLYFDITHSYRSLPMLGMTLIQYARALKDIRVEAIYYGAFESLGPAWQVKEWYQAGERDRIRAPILDLTAFALLQEWSGAARDFVSHGNGRTIADLLRRTEVSHLLENADDETRVKGLLDELADSLSDMTMEIATVRGRRIIAGVSSRAVRDKVDRLERENFVTPLTPLLDKIGEAAARFAEDDVFNGFRAVKWCIEHQLVQQGITLLQEMTVEFLCRMLVDRHQLDSRRAEDRGLVQGAIYHHLRPNVTEEERSEKDPQRWRRISAILGEPIIADFATVYEMLRPIRNAINHSEMTPQYAKSAKGKDLSRYETFEDTLIDCYARLYELVERYTGGGLNLEV